MKISEDLQISELSNDNDSIILNDKERKRALRKEDWHGCLFEKPDGQIYIKISDEVLRQLSTDYNDRDDTEDGYILLANKETGVIEQVVSKHLKSNEASYSFPVNYYQHIEKIDRKNGYFIVGTYHLHPPFSNDEYKNNEGLAGNVLSGADTSFLNHKNNAIQILGHANPDREGEQDLSEFKLYSYIQQAYLPKEDVLHQVTYEEMQERNNVTQNIYTGEVFENMISMAIETEASKNNPLLVENSLEQQPFVVDKRTIHLDTETIIEFTRDRYSLNSSISDEFLLKRIEGAIEKFGLIEIEVRASGEVIISLLGEKFTSISNFPQTKINFNKALEFLEANKVIDEKYYKKIKRIVRKSDITGRYMTG